MIKLIKKWSLIINNSKKLIIILTIFFFCILINKSKIYKLFKKYKDINYNLIHANISELKNYLVNKENRANIIKNGKKFTNNCLKQKKFFSKTYKINIKPVISSIIPVYNSAKTIYNAICSIQNQNFTDLEIILINDYSSDNSSKIIHTLQERDSRIRIITNKKSMGSLYSRSVGILLSKGDFIMPLDDDDMFFNYDIFYYILTLAKNFDFDIIGFKAFLTKCYNGNNYKINDLYNYLHYPQYIVVYQPELSTWMVSKNGNFQLHDVTIWAKCIKSKIYKKAVIHLGIKRYSEYVSLFEDTIVNFIIFNYAYSFLFVNKYGILHLYNKSTASFTIKDNIKLFGKLFLTDIMFDFSKNNSDKNYAIMIAYEIKKKFIKNKLENDRNLKYFKSILNKFINCQYISKKLRNKIKIDFKSFFV